MYGLSRFKIIKEIKNDKLYRECEVDFNDFNDDDLRRMLQFRCNLRGMYLSDEVAKFLLARLSRDSKTLINALETLDSASLREQRRLTTPFVKSVLEI